MPEETQRDDQVSVAYLELLKDCLTASIYDESSWRVLEPSGNFMRRIVLKQLAKRNKVVLWTDRYDPARRQSGADWPLFGYTMIGRKRLDNVEFCVRDVIERRVPGDIVETGTWRGGCCIFMRALLRQLNDSSLHSQFSGSIVELFSANHVILRITSDQLTTLVALH